MTEIADNPLQTGHILSQHATETTENIIKSYVVVVREQLPANRLASIIKLKELKSQSENRRRLKNARPQVYKKRHIFVCRVSHYHDHV